MSILWQIRSILRKNEQAQETLQKGAKAGEPSAPVERRNRKRVNTHKGRRILIIDDSPTISSALRKMLRSAGCVTFESPDAENGLETLRKEKPDLVFLDIVLPGMNGFAALRLMRRDPQTQHIPVIMISGNEQATEQFYAKRIGADDFMKKPFSRHEVFARIENLVEANKLVQIKANDTLSTPSKMPADLGGMSRPVPSMPSSPRPAEAAAKPATATPTAAPTTSAAAAGQTPPTSPVAPTPAKAAQAAAPAATPVIPDYAEPPKKARTPLEARMQLTAMGLQYYNQEQFLAAIERGDALAIELFMIGGGVSTEN